MGIFYVLAAQARHFTMPWWIGAILVGIIFLAAHLYCVTRKYHCPKCGRAFRVKWYAFSTWYHDDERRVAKCPYCKQKGFCKYD
jgi:DNA-directed RNA polymerase subunit RPC12/RpoP